MGFVADMRKDLKRSIIILVSLMALERVIKRARTVQITLVSAAYRPRAYSSCSKIINAEDDDDDDAALSNINKLFARFPRMASNGNELPTSKDANTKKQLESKVSDLLEFGRGATKWPVVREYVDEDETTRASPSEVSPFMRYGGIPVLPINHENVRCIF